MTKTQEIMDLLTHWSHHFNINDLEDCQYLVLLLKYLVENNDLDNEYNEFLLNQIHKILESTNPQDISSKNQDSLSEFLMRKWQQLSQIERAIIPLTFYKGYILPTMIEVINKNMSNSEGQF